MLKKLIAAAILLSAASLCFAADSRPAGTVQAYYFHATGRCATCMKLEQYSREAIEKNFKNELASGRLVFTSVNVDEPENQHFVKDYRLFTRSLVISLVKDGREVRSKNLSRIWDLVRNKEKFYEYVAQEITALLKEL